MLETLIVALARTFLADAGGTASVEAIAAQVVEDLGGIAEFDLSASEVADLLRQYATGGSALARVGDQLVDLTVAADGVPFAHRLTADELAADELELDADLAIVARLAGVDGGLHRAYGEPLRLRLHRQRDAGLGGTTLLARSLVGPSGWLDGFATGDLVRVVATEGFLTVTAEDALDEEAGAFADRVRTDLLAAKEAAGGGDDLPISIEEVHLAGLIDGWLDRTTLAPPFGAVLDATGLERSASLVSRPGTWERYRGLEVLIRAMSAHGDHLEPAGRTALSEVVQAFDRWRHDPSTPPAAALLVTLRDQPEAGLCLEEELVRIDPTGGDLHRFLDAFDASDLPADATVPLATLRAFTAEVEGDDATVEEHLAVAIGADAYAMGAVEASAFRAELRGDAKGAADLLRRVRQVEDPQLQVVEARAKASNPTVGRNDPCPCGSGRKFKQCHQGRTLMSAGTRLYWLLDKARSDLLRVGPVDLFLDLPAPSEEARLLADDVALFDRGGLALFLERRRHLLPDDDVALLERWQGEHPQSVFLLSFTDVDSLTVDLVDQVTGTTTIVWRTEAFDGLEPDDLVWARLLSDTEGGWWPSGIAVPLSPADADLVLAAGDADPVARHGALMGLDVQVRQLAADGHPMVWAATSWDVHDEPVEVEATLDAAFAAAGDGEWELRDGDVAWGRLHLLPAMGLEAEADEGAGPVQAFLSATTDSLPRHRALAAKVAEVLPTAALGWSTVEPISRHRATLQADEILDVVYAGLDDDDDDFEGERPELRL